MNNQNITEEMLLCSLASIKNHPQFENPIRNRCLHHFLETSSSFYRNSPSNRTLHLSKYNQVIVFHRKPTNRIHETEKMNVYLSWFVWKYRLFDIQNIAIISEWLMSPPRNDTYKEPRGKNTKPYNQINVLITHKIKC